MVYVACIVGLLATAPLARADIYHWTGADGEPHFSDRPGPGAEPLRQPPGGGEVRREWRRVEEVLDGDTVRLEDGTVVRLIGVNAPEVARRSRPGESGGYEASEALARRVAGRYVRLETGREPVDRYGRTLAHVFDQDGRNVNAWLLRGGWVHAAVYPPNDRLASVYRRLEAQARRERRGLWRRPVYAILPAAEAVRHRNSFRRLRGKATGSARVGGAVELTLDESLRVRFTSKAIPRFLEAGLGPRGLMGRVVTVRGRVRQRDGRPIVYLRHPLQVEAVE